MSNGTRARIAGLLGAGLGAMAAVLAAAPPASAQIIEGCGDRLCPIQRPKPQAAYQGRITVRPDPKACLVAPCPQFAVRFGAGADFGVETVGVAPGTPPEARARIEQSLRGLAPFTVEGTAWLSASRAGPGRNLLLKPR